MKKLFFTLSAILSTAILCAAQTKIPVILDTDIGTDIDDAFALALIIKSPELEILGVTTVSGDTEARARLAAKFLWEAGGKYREVPVVAGIAGNPQPMSQTHWADGFTSPQIRTQNVADFLREKFDRQPGQITLIAIGELTNVAALLKAEPGVAKKIPRIALMGGSVARGYAPDSPPDLEWNIKSNPRAAQAVFSSGIPIIMVPLDVTAMLKLDAAGRTRIFSQGTPMTNALEALYRLWNRETPTLFDPMAVAMLLKPDICQTKHLAINVDVQGYTRATDEGTPNVTAGVSVNPQDFLSFT